MQSHPPHPLLPQPEEEASVPVYSLGQGRAHNRRQLHGNTRPSLCCAALSLGSPCGGGSPSAPEGNTPLPALLGAPHAGLLASGCRTCLPGHSVCRPPSDPPFHTRLSCLWNRWDRHCEQNATFRFFYLLLLYFIYDYVYCCSLYAFTKLHFKCLESLGSEGSLSVMDQDFRLMQPKLWSLPPWEQAPVLHALYEPVLWLLELLSCLCSRCCSWRWGAKEGVMAYRHISCSLEQLAAGSHPCALAAYCSASHCASQGPIWHGAWIPRVQFSPGVSKGMWEMVQGQLNVAEFPALGELRV